MNPRSASDSLTAAATVPVADLGAKRLELTLRGLILGCAITLVFTAANVYLGLKVGLTFASSIPAAVISMAVLRAFKSTSIYENNIVQTVASSAGTLSSVIFVLPGLVMIGWWTGFPFWQSFGVSAVGGILGVMFTIPLRRALVTTSDLPYPEGVAAAEVLRVGVGTREGLEEGQAGFITVLVGAIVSAAFAAVVAMRVFVDQVAGYVRGGFAASGIGFSLSLALLGAGHLIGISVGLAMLAGLVIAWGIATPVLTALHPAAGSAVDVATNIWAHQVRFIGAGAIGISALWSLGRLALPVWKGVLASIEASRRAKAGERDTLPRTERDLPFGTVVAISLFCLIPLFILFALFLQGGPLQHAIVPLAIAATLYVLVVGFVVSAIAGYMAGLIGSSNSPVSGLAILAVLGIALILVAMEFGAGPAAKPALIAFALFATSALLAAATIANDNLQDLKTGQLVDSTPWRQQVALIVGVIAGAVVIPPILDLLNAGYGFAGAPHLRNAAQALPAPQATLISALAGGVIGAHANWAMIGIGALVGVAIVAIDELLRATGRYRMPPLAVGIGIYLPVGTISTVVIGAVLGWVYNRWAARTARPAFAKRLGVLLASGLIVGESIFGVILAGIIVASDKSTPLAVVGDAFVPVATVVGGIGFVVVVAALYRWIASCARRSGRAQATAPQ